MNGLKPVIFEYDSVMIGQHYHWILCYTTKKQNRFFVKIYKSGCNLRMEIDSLRMK